MHILLYVALLFFLDICIYIHIRMCILFFLSFWYSTHRTHHTIHILPTNSLLYSVLVLYLLIGIAELGGDIGAHAPWIAFDFHVISAGISGSGSSGPQLQIHKTLVSILLLRLYIINYIIKVTSNIVIFTIYFRYNYYGL